MPKSRQTARHGRCCPPTGEHASQGALWGLIYGLVPHTFCILFIVFSIIGATVATEMMRRLLYVRHLFEAILALSVGLATLSALLYLRHNGLLSWAGARRKWRYLSVMYGATLAVNLLLVQLVFPAVANVGRQAPVGSTLAADGQISVQAEGAASSATHLATVVLEVAIPCPGHAPLIIGELQAMPGVQAAHYERPNLFALSFDPRVTSLEEILAQRVFEYFAAEIRR